ncbi:MAG: SAM-dependent methyltransferase [Parachlamydiales bacterium]|jgi:hypothetical protein
MKILEQSVPLNKSNIWNLQTSIYSKLGLQAWTHRGVPSYMTNNPYTAKQYAQLIVSYLRDGLDPNSKKPISSSDPIYIFDLGAGTGRFAYVFLKQFFKLIKGIQYLESLTIRYVLTDIVDSNLDFCEHHNYLKSFIEKGIIDFAHFSYDQKEPLQLRLAKTALDHTNVKNPVILIANYFFDTIPQDLIRYHGGNWEEGHITIKGPESTSSLGHPFEDTEILEKLHFEFSYLPISPEKKANYEGIPEAHSLIDEYSNKLDGVPFTVPQGAFKTIRFFEELSQSRLLVISGDQGYSSIEQLKNSGEPRFAIHGAFSMAVNYNALARFFDKKQGKGFVTTLSDPVFQVFVGLLGGNASDYPELSVAHKEYLESFEPKDYWSLATLVQSEWTNPSLDTLLLILKLGSWDPMNLYTFYSMIREQVPTATPKQKEELRTAIHEVWENFYPIHALEGEFIMNLGVMFFEMQYFAEALGFLQRSLMITGDNATTYTNMAACYLSLFNPEAAHKCFEKAKAMHDAVGVA